MKALLPYWPMISTFLSLLISGLAVWVCWSIRQFAKTEVERITASSETRLAAAIREQETRVDGHHDRIGEAEHSIREIRDDISNLPTKADLARVEGEIRSVGNEVGAANRGITRIEGFFLAKGVERS